MESKKLNLENCIKMNKTELTKRKIHGTLNFINGTPVIIFTISSHINKIRKLFPTIQVLHECCDKYGMGDFYITCTVSSDLSEVIDIVFHINCFKYEYKNCIDCIEIFNNEELEILKEESMDIIHKYKNYKCKGYR